MEILEIIKDLQANGVTIKTDGKFLELEPPEKITNELIERLRKHKPAIIAELKREQRQEKVLKMLEERPETHRAFVTDTESNRHNVILTLAIRNAGTCELLIPKHKYDPFAVLRDNPKERDSVKQSYPIKQQPGRNSGEHCSTGKHNF